jgi:NAD(P)H-dependent flavin oxidoreductase YrpB (nitropropane dioxygenase family)
MLRTRLCDLLGIEVPIIQGPLGVPWGQSMDLPAAVCAAGGLRDRSRSSEHGYMPFERHLTHPDRP